MDNEQKNYNVDALRTGDRIEFAKLVEDTSPQVFHTALGILANEQDAEDVLQETYLKALKALPGFEGRSSLSTWLHRIAVNEALMLLRKKKGNGISMEEIASTDEDGEPGEVEIVDFCCLPEKELLSGESRQFMDAASQRLPDTLRSVFVLRDLEGYSIQETAELLQISEMNVKTRLLRARLHLRQQLSGYFAEKVQKQKEGEQ